MHLSFVKYDVIEFFEIRYHLIFVRYDAIRFYEMILSFFFWKKLSD